MQVAVVPKHSKQSDTKADCWWKLKNFGSDHETSSMSMILRPMRMILSEGFEIVQTVFEKGRSKMSKNMLVIAEVDVTSVKVVQSS